jgi:DNA-binding MarR family transcriptional regulator
MTGARSEPSVRAVTDREYEQLLEFRTGLRQFLRWSETQAEAAGVTPAQHQLLLAVRGQPDPLGPTISDVADWLLLRHHSAVELIDRAEASGLVRRVPDPDDGRLVRVKLTARGGRVLERLAGATFEELRRLGPRMRGLYEGLDSTGEQAQLASAVTARRRD